MLISPEYRALNEQLHREKVNWGSGASEEVSWIAGYIRGFDSVLDYGCGKGRLTIGCPDFRRYDPCVPVFAAEPYAADLVMCQKTLEHVEPECVDAVLDHLKELANKRVLIKVSTFETDLKLADGSSPHRTVQDADWWLDKFLLRWRLVYAERMKRGLRFVGENKAWQ
jgi:hypothetical protein